MKTGRAVLFAPQGNVHRGFYLFSDSDSMEALRIPFPDISRPLVQNIQLSYALFDGLHLLSAFESDGATPKTTTKNTNDQSNVRTVKNIFTEKNMNFSEATAPLASDTMMAAGTFSPTTKGVSQSIYLTESSVQSAGDAALGFRAWGTINLDIPNLRELLGDEDGNVLQVGKTTQPAGPGQSYVDSAGKGPTGNLNELVMQKAWEDGRGPVTLKTFTLSDIKSITMSTYLKVTGSKGSVKISTGIIKLTLNLPSGFGNDKLGIIAQAGAAGWTTGYKYRFQSDSLEITYNLSRTSENRHQFDIVTLFFGILATNE